MANKPIGVFWITLGIMAFTAYCLGYFAGVTARDAKNLEHYDHPVDEAVVMEKVIPWWEEVGAHVTGSANGAYLYTPGAGETSFIWCSSEFTCLHEVGHAVFYRYRWIVTSEFEKDLLHYAENIDKENLRCGSRPARYYPWSFDCLLVGFPGLMGNSALVSDMGGLGWGGPSEFYADAYAFFRLGMIDIPEELSNYWN